MGIYVSAARTRTFKRNRPSYMLWCIAVIFCLLLFLSGSLLIDMYKESREELVYLLKKENEVIRVNNRLKTDLSGITQTRLLELKAKERLGLEKPTEEEVLVLR